MITRKPADSEPFSALAFKIMADPFVGQLTFIRVYSGQLKSGDSVLNAGRGRSERIGRLLKMHANKREDINEILAGDICAAVGLKNVSTGDTICDEKHPIALESITFAVPVISVAVEPKTKADQEKMGMALSKLAQEDPTFKVHTDPDSGQTIISGMGELHLEIIVDRMMREYKVEANVGKPQVAYRETIRRKSEAEGKYIRQTGGRGQYGHAKIRIEPNEPGKGYEFLNEVVGGSVPKEFIKPIDQGIQEALEGGILAGYPMVDVKVDTVRRQLPRRRFERNGIQDCRLDGFQGSCAQSLSGAAGAGDGGRSGNAGRLCRSDHGRLEFASRADRRHGASRRFAGDQGDCAAGGDVWLRDAYALQHARPRRVLDAFCAL